MSGVRGRSPGAATDRRRRLVLLSIGLLILLGMGPILGHHVAGGMDRLLAGTDHLGALCLIALHALLRPVHDLFLLLLAVGLTYAAWDRVQAELLLRRTLSALRWTPPGPGSAIEAAAREAGVDPARIQIARGLPVPAFTAGWLHPRIYLAGELGERLSRRELAAVLAHEGAHLARRDPLCLALLRFLGNTLFWIPALRRLAEDCADEVEIRADDAARLGHPLALASAIVAVAEWMPVRRRGPGVGIHHPGLLSRRVRRLAGDDVPARSHVTRRSWMGTVGALALVWITGIVMAHPLSGSRSHHCEHGREPAWTHLFCAAAAPPPSSPRCPHETR